MWTGRGSAGPGPAGQEAGILSALICDAGMTEFHGQPTFTCLALEPPSSGAGGPAHRGAAPVLSALCPSRISGEHLFPVARSQKQRRSNQAHRLRQRKANQTVRSGAGKQVKSQHRGSATTTRRKGTPARSTHPFPRPEISLEGNIGASEQIPQRYHLQRRVHSIRTSSET